MYSTDQKESDEPDHRIGPVPQYEQTEGDPEKGYDALVNKGYVNCGIPAQLSGVMPMGDESDRIQVEMLKMPTCPIFGPKPHQTQVLIWWWATASPAMPKNKWRIDHWLGRFTTRLQYRWQ